MFNEWLHVKRKLACTGITIQSDITPYLRFREKLIRSDIKILCYSFPPPPFQKINNNKNNNINIFE